MFERILLLKKGTMKRLLFVLGVLVFVSCSKEELAVLTQQEKDDLSFLREEEKLARDVYLFAFDKYGEEIFNSISQSEQKHMDKLLGLLNKYKISDPASTQRGVFSNAILQNLYNELTLQADSSLVEALKVGATIEDLDIRDIDLNMSRTDKLDIQNVYIKLGCGSYNHMRGFTDKLTENQVEYEPQFITIEKYTTIINSENEKCGGR